MDVVLVMFKSDGSRRDFPVKGSRMVVGRTNSCDLRIPLSSVSRQHCEISVEDERVTIRDLGSSNGTFHNRERVQHAELSRGDEIVIGPVVFKVVIDGEPSDIEAVPTIVGDDTGAAGETSADRSEAIAESDEQDAMTTIEPESHSPTVDYDDPIAALEALAESEEDEADAEEMIPLLEEVDEEDEEPVPLEAVVDEDEDEEVIPLTDAGDSGEEAVSLEGLEVDDEDDDDNGAIPLAGEEEEADDIPLLAEEEDDDKPRRKR